MPGRPASADPTRAFRLVPRLPAARDVFAQQLVELAWLFKVGQVTRTLYHIEPRTRDLRSHGDGGVRRDEGVAAGGDDQRGYGDAEKLGCSIRALGHPQRAGGDRFR